MFYYIDKMLKLTVSNTNRDTARIFIVPYTIFIPFKRHTSICDHLNIGVVYYKMYRFCLVVESFE